MTAQKHIDAIGASLLEIEERSKDVRKAARKLDAAVLRHHELLDEAQKAYAAEPYQGGGVIVPFSGGTNKPPVDDPNEPVEP